ncbi:tape-measure protein [Streptomyces sp. ODS05-4]|uniref:tape-measure protein n=1 Tax=Streptomyces sp. ODS05-4 TaxID=2944939 RepID=UPI00210C5CCF|nr:tape-measure protein [Streptomyces sp. ODS05-4]
MSAALALGPSAVGVELQSLDRALKSFRGQLHPVAQAVRSLRAAPVRAATALGGLRSGAASATTQIRQIRDRAQAAGRSLTRKGRTASSAGTGLRTGGSKVKSAGAALGSLVAEAAPVETFLALLGPTIGPVVQIMTVLGGALTAAAVAMTAVNVAMRANPLGFLAGLIVPVLAAILTYAMNTETGQRIMKQVFDHVLKVFQQIAKFLGPIVTGYGTVVGGYFKAVGIVITAVVEVVGAAVSGDFGKARGSISKATDALSALVRRPWNAFKTVIQPVLDWLTRKPAEMFGRVKDATGRTMNGMGDFMSTGLQMLAGVITGPVKGLIAFANWVIDGLNSLSGEFLGKKFGIKLDKIPQLAEGGVVDPGRGASAVRPLSALDRLRPAEPGHRGSPDRAPAPSPDRGRLHTYREPAGRSALAIAEDLLFLHRTAA